jgi:outer membrane lipopolysaccharide assembly protein LptE/RlpB
MTAVNKSNKFEVPTDKFLSDTLTFHQTNNVMKNLRINDESIAKAVSLTIKDANDDEVIDYINNLRVEEELIKNDLEILENTSEVFLNRE